MKIFTVPANENWVCDRFTKEWMSHNLDIVTEDIQGCDILWLLAGWRWNHIPENILRNKFLVV